MKRIGEILTDMGLVRPETARPSAGSGVLPEVIEKHREAPCVVMPHEGDAPKTAALPWIEPKPNEAELYAHRAMRRFNLMGKVVSGLPETALAKVSPKASREAVLAYCESLVEELVAQAYKDGKAKRRATKEPFLGGLERERPGETPEDAARALGYLVADRAGNICTLEEGRVLFTGDPTDAARIVAVVNSVVDEAGKQS